MRARLSVQQYSTSVLRGIGATVLLANGQQVCRQPCRITIRATLASTFDKQVRACCQSMHANSTYKQGEERGGEGGEREGGWERGTSPACGQLTLLNRRSSL